MNHAIHIIPACVHVADSEASAQRGHHRTDNAVKCVGRQAPYLTVLVPEALVAAMPPMEASAPGSTVKNRPVARSSSLSCLRVTPAWTRQSMSSACTCSQDDDDDGKKANDDNGEDAYGSDQMLGIVIVIPAQSRT